MEANFTMRLEKARPLVLVQSEPLCGHCLSQRVELAEFETTRYRDHEGEKTVHKLGYFCLDCEQISLPAEGSLESPFGGPYPAMTPDCSPLLGPTTW
jgi:hypothetical protein